MEMPRWARRVLGVLALGGGAIGFIATLMALLGSDNPVVWLLLLVFLGIYAFGVVCGIAMLEGHADALRANTAYWAVQVPAISTYAFGYFVSSGGHVTVYFNWVLQKIQVDFLLGSVFRFNLMQEPDSRRVGINVFALAIVLFLIRCRRRVGAARVVPAEPAIA